MKLLGMIIQIINWMSDILVLGAVIWVFIEFNAFVGIFIFLLAHSATKSVGGWFYSWRPSSIHDFRENWRKLTK